MDSNNAEIAAGEWLARMDREVPTPADLAVFNRWKAADARNAAAYARLEAAWQALDRIRTIRPRGNEPIDSDYLRCCAASHWLGESFQNHDADSVNDSAPHCAHDSIPDFPRTCPSRSSSRYRRSLLTLAASLLVTIAGIWIERAHDSAKIFSTSVGGFQRIILEDQSAIELNTDTEIRIVLTPKLRRVELVRGEASFEVAHDISRPFVVSAGIAAVRAVGTKFNVRRLDSAVEVTVDEGKVAVGEPSLLETRADLPARNVSQLSAGQSALASVRGVKLKDLPKAEMARRLAWQNQMLVFDGEALVDVVAQFNRYNERQLVIADPRLAALQIGGYFRPTNLDEFVGVLQSDFGVRVDTEGDRLMLAIVGTN